MTETGGTVRIVQRLMPGGIEQCFAFTQTRAAFRRLAMGAHA